jgi:hypothetical protein
LTSKVSHRKLFAVAASLLVIAVLVAAFLVIKFPSANTVDNSLTSDTPTPNTTNSPVASNSPVTSNNPSNTNSPDTTSSASASPTTSSISGSSIELGLNYAVGEKMNYTTTARNTVQQDSIIGEPQTYNQTISYEVLSFDGKSYSINQTGNVTISNKTTTVKLTLSVGKTDYYKNFINGGPDVFANYASNPTIAAYLTKTAVKVGDVWTLPVSTGTATNGLKGQITLTFHGLEELTTSAGTFKVFKIDISSGTLTIHSTSIDSGTMQITGTTYLEQGTCRLIKSDLTEKTSTFQDDAYHTGGSTTVTVTNTEKMLSEYSAK